MKESARGIRRETYKNPGKDAERGGKRVVVVCGKGKKESIDNKRSLNHISRGRKDKTLHLRCSFLPPLSP